MTIAELFVNLGVKGDGSAQKALQGVKTGLGDVKSMSLEAKAAIIGAIYALERMMSTSAQQGTSLLNFTSLTGMSAQALQQWQYAARQAGVDGEELTGSLKSVQNGMSNMLLGKGAPEGLAMVANKVGFDQSRARDTMYVMQQLQKFAQTVPADIGNQMIKSFGVSDNVIAAMRRNAFNPSVMSHAPKYSDNEIMALNKVDVAWSNIGNKIKMAFGHFTAKNGLGLVSEISGATTEFIKFAQALASLADKIKIIEGIGKIFEGWGLIFNGLSSAVDKLMNFASSDNKASDLKSGAMGAFGGISDAWKGMNIDSKEKLEAYQKKLAAESNILPKVNGGQSGSGSDVTINQNLNFQHEGKDHHKTGQSVHKAVKDAYRQYQAQGQGS